MTFDATCVRCGSVLKHVGTDSDDTDLDTLHHHYRCVADVCDADGGTVITCDGAVTRVVGPAVDAGYGSGAADRPAIATEEGP